MGSLLGDWPSFDPHNFSQLRPSDPTNPSKITPTTYHPTHNRTDPPPNQVIGEEILPKNTGIVEVEDSFQYTMIEELHHPCTHPLYILISTEATDILLRHFYQRAEEKLRPKRAASEHLIPDHGCKQPRGSFEHTSS